MHTTELNDLPSTSVRRPILVTVINLLIIVAGIAALMGLEVRELPDVDRPFVTVTARLPGAAPETVDAEVTSKLEGAVARVSGVKSIRSSSEENSTRIVIELNEGVDINDAASEVREAVSRAERQLPDTVERVSVIKADSDARSVLDVAVTSESLSIETLTRRVETDIAPVFLAIEGVADVSLEGDRERVLRINIDPLSLNSFGLSIADVRSAVSSAPFDIPVGSLQSVDMQLIVRADAAAETAEQIGDIRINDNTKVRDVARVYFGPNNAQSYVRLNGLNVIGLGVVRQAGSNTIEISDQALKAVDQLNERFPDMQITVISDDAQFIRKSVEEVGSTLVMTILLVILTLWLFIGSLRTTLIPAVSIPVAIIGVLSVIWIAGFSLNILTLLALVLATGLIVDDAIVVTENIQRLRHQGLSRRAAAVMGTREVFFAVIATTAVLTAVFLPIAFLPSLAGKLFREFGVVLASSVIISSFVALTLVPAYIAKMPVTDLSNKTPRTTLLIRFGRWFNSIYQRSLNKTLAYPVALIFISLLAAGSAATLYQKIDNELLPTEDRGVLRVFGSGPDGVGLNFMDRQAFQMEDVLAPYIESGEITNVYTVVGKWDWNRVLVIAPLADWSERSLSQQEIAQKIRGPLSAIPGAPARVWGGNSLNLRGQGGGGIELAITGENYQQIYQTAQALNKELVDKNQGFVAGDIDYQPSQPQLRVIVNRVRASELSVPLQQISDTLRTTIGGDDIGDLSVGDESIPIIIQTDRLSISGPQDLNNLYVSSDSGQLIPLSAVATVVEEGVAAELNRRAQRRAIQVEFELPEGMPLGQAIDIINDAANATMLTENSIIWLGEARDLKETNHDLIITFALAFLVVFLVLAAQFENLLSAVIVMLTVPFGIAAAILALYVTGTSVNIYSQIGLVMLIGIIAKNSVLLVEFADQLREQGQPINEAITNAASIRLRPIMMTLASTVLGALPLILSEGAGAEARNAIGWVIFGGLGFATLFTLYLTPALYQLIAPLAKPRGHETAELNNELANINITI